MQADSNRYMLQLSLPTKLSYQETKEKNQPQSAKHYTVSLQREKEIVLVKIQRIMYIIRPPQRKLTLALALILP